VETRSRHVTARRFLAPQKDRPHQSWALVYESVCVCECMLAGSPPPSWVCLSVRPSASQPPVPPRQVAPPALAQLLELCREEAAGHSDGRRRLSVRPRIVMTAERHVPELEAVSTLIKVPPLRVRPGDVAEYHRFFLKVRLERSTTTSSS
jgi:hypothetical protein